MFLEHLGHRNNSMRITDPDRVIFCFDKKDKIKKIKSEANFLFLVRDFSAVCDSTNWVKKLPHVGMSEGKKPEKSVLYSCQA